MNRRNWNTRRKGTAWFSKLSDESRNQLSQEVKYKFHKYKLLGSGIELSKAKVRDEMNLSMNLISDILKKKKPLAGL